MHKDLKIGVVVPAYNEERLIGDTLRGMPEWVDRVYVVNDASTDRTGEIAAAFNSHRYLLLTHGQNRGVGAAIATGYRKALEEGMDIAVVMAGDNQMDPRFLPELLQPLIEGRADYAKGNRLARVEDRKGMSDWRYFGNWLLTLLTKIASGYWRIRDPQNGYTAISGTALNCIDLDELYPRYGYCNDILARLNAAGGRVVDVPMPARYGTEMSKIKYRKYVMKVSPLLVRCFLWRITRKLRYRKICHGTSPSPNTESCARR